MIENINFENITFKERIERNLVYILIPLCEYDRFYKGEIVSYCKIGQTSVYDYECSDHLKYNYINELYNRTNVTYFPEMMIVVGYILSDKNKSYGDGYVRKKLLENSNQNIMLLSSQLRIKSNERTIDNRVIVNSGNEFVYNITKSDLENIKDKLCDMNIHKFCIYDKCDIDYRKLPIYRSYRYMVRNRDKDDKNLFANLDLLDICNKSIDISDRYKQEKENEIKEKEKWKDNFFKLLNLYLSNVIPNKKVLDDVKYALCHGTDFINLFSIEDDNEKIENILKVLENIGLKDFDCIFDENGTVLGNDGFIKYYGQNPVIASTQNPIKNNIHYPKPKCKEDITRFIVPGMSQNEIVQTVMENFDVKERTARTYLKENGLTRPYRTKEVEEICEVVDECSTDIKDNNQQFIQINQQLSKMWKVIEDIQNQIGKQEMINYDIKDKASHNDEEYKKFIDSLKDVLKF